MYQYDDPSCVASLPAPAAAGTPGYFTDGNPVSGQAPTILTADYMNSLMLELLNVVKAAGITPGKAVYDQLLSAIRRIGQNTVVLADVGTVNAYAAVNVTPLVAATWTDGVVQAVKIAHTNTGVSTYSPDGLAAIPVYGLGLQPLQGGELYAGGTAILMHATVAGVNGGNPICVLMECAGGAQQVAPATQSQHAVQLGQVQSMTAGVVGSARNLKMSVTVASASGTLTADEIIVETALGGTRYCLSAFSKTINLATTGAGGMDTGSAPTSGFVAVYAIYNPIVQASALLATNATSAVAPNIYGGANMPSGYTASGLVSVVPTTSSGQIPVLEQRDRDVDYFYGALYGGSGSASYTSLSLAAAVPPNAIRWKPNANFSAGTAGSLSMGIAPTSGGNSTPGYSAIQSYGISVGGNYTPVLIKTAQTTYFATSGTGTFTINSYGYLF